MCDLGNKWKSIDALNCKYVVENSGRGEFVVKGRIEGGWYKNNILCSKSTNL